MVDAAHLTAVPASMTVAQSRTSWGFEIGRHRLSVTRTREARTIGQMIDAPRSRPSHRPAWPLAIGAFASVSAFGLFVFGAVASEPLMPRQQVRYSVSLPVPVRASRPVKDTRVHKIRTAPALVDAGEWIGSNLSGPRFDAADEPYVVKAMHTGAFQEWLNSDGQRRFLNVGPEQAEGDRRCRDLALLIRASDNSSRTRSARRCLPASSGHTTSMTGGDDRISGGRRTPDMARSLPFEEDARSSMSRTNDGVVESADLSYASQ